MIIVANMSINMVTAIKWPLWKQIMWSNLKKAWLLLWNDLPSIVYNNVWKERHITKFSELKS